MKRKIKAFLVICYLAICLTLCLTACGDKCEHTYDNACDITCNECGEERTVAHDWSAATCTSSKTCKICGATEGEALGHEWTTPDVDLCEVQSTCSRCGATDGENKEHTPEADDGDCSTEVKCSVCGDVTTPAGQHTPNEDDGDCTTPITCSVCGTTTTPAKDSHAGGTATCTEKAKCTACGTAYGTVDANNHIDENTDHICDRACGKTDIGTHADSNTDHACDYGCSTTIGTHADTNNDHNCEYGCSTTIGVHSDSENDDDHTCDYGCGATLENCYGGIATCTAKAECTICGNGYGELDPDNHIDSNKDHICDRECGKTDVGTHEDKNNDHNCEYGCTTTIGTHSDSENDDDHTCDYGCGATLEDCKGGTATCLGSQCVVCGAWYGDTDATNHASDEFTYTANADGTTHTKKYKCCDAVADSAETHTFNADTCSCGEVLIQIEFTYFELPFGDSWNTEVNLDGSTGTIGTANAGYTDWVNGDQIFITLTSKYSGTQTAVIIYNNHSWDGNVSFSYLKSEIPTVSTIYAPCYEVTEEGVMQFRSGMRLGMTEYLVGEAKIDELSGRILNIIFTNATRTYSRLRIVGLANQTLTVTTTGFTPAGATTVATEAYTLTTDDKGNAYLYGTFAVDATVSVKYGNVVLKDYAFTVENNPNGTEQGKSYALDARPIIDGTLGGKTSAEESDITELMNTIKNYVDNGITTIIVTGEKPAMITITGTYTSYTITAIGEAIYRLSGSGTHSADNPYNGKIDLILPDVTEIVDYEFEDAFALNSITLPKVTTVGNGAFYHCKYLQELTFGSVVTSIKQDSFLPFDRVGEYVDGGLCDLVLNRGQASAAAEYQPNIGTNRWWNNFEWKSITLI